MTCEPQLSRVFLGGLPPMLKVNIRNDSVRPMAGKLDSLFCRTMRMLPGPVVRLCSPSCPKSCSSKRCDAISRCSRQDTTGWLAGVRDPEVGKALALLHRKPAHPWTIAALANEVGISRSVLAERFRRYLSETPMAYLTRWRLQLGAQLLTSTSNSVATDRGRSWV